MGHLLWRTIHFIGQGCKNCHLHEQGSTDAWSGDPVSADEKNSFGRRWRIGRRNAKTKKNSEDRRCVKPEICKRNLWVWTASQGSCGVHVSVQSCKQKQGVLSVRQDDCRRSAFVEIHGVSCIKWSGNCGTHYSWKALANKRRTQFYVISIKGVLKCIQKKCAAVIVLQSGIFWKPNGNAAVFIAVPTGSMRTWSGCYRRKKN